MKKTFKFNLVKLAKGSGGDKFETDEITPNGKPYTIYIPQELTRTAGLSVDSMYITFNSDKEN